MPDPTTPRPVLTIKQDQLDVTPRDEPDPRWSHRDAAGHEHRWHLEGETATLPTCIRVQDAEATEEYPALSHLECRHCGEHVRPGRRAPDCRRYVAGLRRYYIDGRLASEAEVHTLFPEIAAMEDDPDD